MSGSDPELVNVTGLTWAELLSCLELFGLSNSEIVQKLDLNNKPEFLLCSFAVGANKP